MATSRQICERLLKAAEAKTVLFVDLDGSIVGSAGKLVALPPFDAGRLLSEREFVIGREDGEGDVLYFSRVGARRILLVIFDRRTTFPVVQAQARIAQAELEAQ